MQAIDLPTDAAVIRARAPVIYDTRQPISPAPNLWERIAIAVRARGYSLATERAYVHWAKRLAAHHGRTHPGKLGPVQVQQFLNHLAVDRECSPSTCKQALCALLFRRRRGFPFESTAWEKIAYLIRSVAPQHRRGLAGWW